MATRVYLGLGANLGDRQGNLLRAVTVLGERGMVVVALSPFYETEPWGVTAQPRFLNAAAAVETTLPPHALLDALKEIERDVGREPGVRYGPRPLDLDILLYGDLVIATPRLCVPHAGMLARSTVLVPLADIAPQVVHPVSMRTIAAHLAALGAIHDVALYPPGLGP